MHVRYPAFRLSTWAVLAVLCFHLYLPERLKAQTSIDLSRQSKNIDFSSAIYTKPFKSGTALPSTCNSGETFFLLNAVSGMNFYACTATNTWVAQGLGVSSFDQISGTVANEQLPQQPDFLSVQTGDGATAGELRLYEKQTNGDNFTSWLGTDSLTSNLRYRLPVSAPSANQVLQASSGPDGDGIVTTAWANVQSDGGGSFDPLTTVNETEEFFTGASASGYFGKWGWRHSGTTLATPTTTDWPTHLGVALLTTGTVSGNIAYISSNNILTAIAKGVGGTAGWSITFLVRLGATTNIGAKVGWIKTSASFPQTDSVAVKFNTDDGDTNWELETCDGSSCTHTDTGVTASTNWTRITISCSTAGTIKAQVNNASAVSTTSNVDAGDFVDLAALVVTNTAAAKALNIDMVSLSLTGLPRY